MDRTNGTSEALVTYRELAPSPALRDHVRAYYSFVPGGAAWRDRRPVTREVRFAAGESFCSPLLADGRASLVVELGGACELGGGWTFGQAPTARVLGPLRIVGAPAGDIRAEMVGAYLRPGAAPALLHAPAQDLTDRVIALEDLWGAPGARLAEDLAELGEAARIDRLEAALLARLRPGPPPRAGLDVLGLAHRIGSQPVGMSVRRLAEAAGVSRQHLARAFREAIGVSPKRYARLARFQAGLVYAGAGPRVPWAQVAVDLGYADQSHMIAEFRELSSLTPDTLASRRWFHPFILEARLRQARQLAPARHDGVRRQEPH